MANPLPNDSHSLPAVTEEKPPERHSIWSVPAKVGWLYVCLFVPLVIITSYCVIVQPSQKDLIDKTPNLAAVGVWSGIASLVAAQVIALLDTIIRGLFRLTVSLVLLILLTLLTGIDRLKRRDMPSLYEIVENFGKRREQKKEKRIIEAVLASLDKYPSLRRYSRGTPNDYRFAEKDPVSSGTTPSKEKDKATNYKMS